jgi:peptide deformylase
MRKIILYPDPVLRTKTPVIEKVDRKLEKEIGELKKVLESCENGAGLAATQIGLKRRFFGVKDWKTKEVRVYINPKIIRTFGEKVYSKIKHKEGKQSDFLEGCLSFPDLFGRVKRYLRIEAEWMNQGPKILEDFEAIIFQHELDHLNGVLFIDHIKEEKGKLYRWVGEKMTEEDLEIFSR